jgi:hypothetical protein
MNIPIEQIKALRATIELGAKGVTSLPLEEISPALREVIEQGAREINSLVNVLILLENPGIAKELDELTEQCGVNTSSTFNTPPKDDPGDPTAELSPAEFADLADQLEEDEEPRESTPVEVLIDKIMERELPDRWERLAKDAQAFLDADTSLRELAQYALEDAARELEGKTAVKTVLWQLDKRLQEVLNLHGEENKTD